MPVKTLPASQNPDVFMDKLAHGSNRQRIFESLNSEKGKSSYDVMLSDG